MGDQGEPLVEQEISPELIEEIEKSDFKADDKVNLILTLGGLKPASELDLTVGRGRFENFDVVSEDRVNEHHALIEGTGLAYKVNKREVVEDWQDDKDKPGRKFKASLAVQKFFIARSAEGLDTLMRAIEAGDNEAIGRAFGIPKTAAEAFVGKREKLDLSTLPDEVRESDEMLFSSPTLSADNWRSEMEQGRVWSDFVKRTSPEIHRKYIEAMKNNKIRHEGK